jgi:hypothetical protein
MFPLRRVHPFATLLQDSQNLSWPTPGKSNTSLFDPHLAQRLTYRLDVHQAGALREREVDQLVTRPCGLRAPNAERCLDCLLNPEVHRQ